jgi:hypothetical protein
MTPALGRRSAPVLLAVLALLGALAAPRFAVALPAADDPAATLEGLGERTQSATEAAVRPAIRTLRAVATLRPLLVWTFALATVGVLARRRWSVSHFPPVVLQPVAAPRRDLPSRAPPHSSGS